MKSSIKIDLAVDITLHGLETDIATCERNIPCIQKLCINACTVFFQDENNGLFVSSSRLRYLECLLSAVAYI